jgi:hypothetical protein
MRTYENTRGNLETHEMYPLRIALSLRKKLLCFHASRNRRIMHA